jgi:tetratricopeptide (TPR) repeat protein
MKTKEFDDAIKHYNKSIELNPEEATTYCNRALAFIRLKSKYIIEKFKYKSIKINLNIYRIRKRFK